MSKFYYITGYDEPSKIDSSAGLPKSQDQETVKMKLAKFYAGVACLLSATYITAAAPTAHTKSSTDIPRTNGRLFVIDGKTQYFAGNRLQQSDRMSD